MEQDTGEQSTPKTNANTAEPKPIKNIILCSDGTGNSGGKGNETNVWRLYRGIDIRSSVPAQVAYYDDGVGTQEFKYLKAFSGAVGLGFSRNVREMYKFLVHAYDPDMDNRIYLFGFSRGAFTVRAFAAFVAVCGVIKWGEAEAEDGGPSGNDSDLDLRIKELVRDYQSMNKRRSKSRDGTASLQTEIERDELANIQFMGVWDTVSAVGVPFGFGFDWIVKRLFTFYFRDLKLHPKVKYARHAVAIDDERKSFRPLVWDEREETDPAADRQARIKQVWFAGMHSNVGGGYPKQGMSYEALAWMLDEITLCNETEVSALKIEDGLEEEVHQKADVFDMMYDSRSGAAAYYRPKMRNIGRFCADSGIAEVKVHTSALRRMAQKGRSYHPIGLPTDMEIVSDPPGSAFAATANARQEARAQASGELTFLVRGRDGAHLSLVYFTLLIVGSILNEVIGNGVAFFACITASLLGLYAMESLAQKVIRLRGWVYLLGVVLVGASCWALWDHVPELEYESMVIPVLLMVIIARIGYRQYSKPQPLFAIAPSQAGESDNSRGYPHYRRVESLMISGFIFVAIGLLIIDGHFGILGNLGDSDVIREVLGNTIGLVEGVLPTSLVEPVQGLVTNHPVWSAIAILGLGTANAMMRRYKRKLLLVQERSWDVVRRRE